MKNLIVFLFSLILSVVFSTSASAYDVEIGGIYYNLISKSKTAEVTSGEEKYSGEVVIPSSIISEGQQYKVISIVDKAFSGCSGLTSVDIPSSVTSIGVYAFQSCSGLTLITIPNSVTSIKEGAFRYCSGLTSVTIPNSVTSIEGETFNKCSGLKSVAIPNSVTRIGKFAFQRCSLKSVTIPNSVESIGESAFRECSGLTSVTIPNSVTIIGRSAFNGCSGLTSVTIPNSVTSIEWGAFENCRGLTSVTIGNSVTSIGDYAFKRCSGLTSVTIPNSVTSIGGGAFSGCSGLTSITIPNSVTKIGGEAFKDCSGLKSITIPNFVTIIGADAFYGCSSLTSVDIPSSVTRIGERAFYGCSGLTSITIPNSVIDIYRNAFAKCSELENVYCYAEKVPLAHATAFEESYIEYSTLHVPSSALSKYEAIAPWSDFGTIKEILSTIQAVVGSTGIATYCSSSNLDFTDFNGVSAYIASEYNSEVGTITMTKVNEVPAGTGFILKGSPKTYNIPVKSDVNTSFVNLLVGTVVETEVPSTSNGYDNYILGNGDKGVAFYKSNGASPLAANKAYLRLPASGSSSAKAVRMSFDDDATTEILLLEGENTEETATSPVYDLNGMQKSGISKGWNIVNGKKILIKK